MKKIEFKPTLPKKKGQRQTARLFERYLIEIINNVNNVVFLQKNHEAPKHSSKNLPDFIGLLKKGKMIMGEAKSVKDLKSFSLNNIKEHQLEQLKVCSDNNGVSFLGFCFWTKELNYSIVVITYKDFIELYDKSVETGRKSIKNSDIVEKSIYLEKDKVIEINEIGSIMK